MSIRKLNYAKLNRLSFITLLLIFIFLFQACKKADISNTSLSANNNSVSTKDTPAIISEQPKDFFTLSVNAPNAEKAIVREMQSQFKENDIRNFLNQYGQPLWKKILKLWKNENGSVTYAIPTQKGGEISGFFAATIDSASEIKFEMHRKSAIALKKAEYSYANITLNKSKGILNYFSDKSNVNPTTQSSETNNLWDCSFYWVEQTSLQSSNFGTPQDTTTQNTTGTGGGNGGYWVIVCIYYEGPGGGGTGGGETGG